MNAGITILLLASLVTPSGKEPQEAKAKQEFAGLQGAWALAALERNGKEEDVVDRYPPWVIKGEKVVYGGEELALLRVDATTNPKCIDLTFRPAQNVYEGIFSVEDGTLKICINRETEGQKERPNKFTTMDKANWRMMVFKRLKDGERADYKGTTGFVGMMLSFDREKKEVIINDVFDKSPGKKAGLEKNDILLKAGDAEATDLMMIVQVIRQARPGTDLTLKVKREGKEKEIKVAVGVFPFRFVLE
jgi:uncharacterized protein (TIGR03067 family)